MLRSAVVDASPLIFLARTGLLDVLHNAAETVFVTPAVALEVQAREGQDDEAVSALATMPWLRSGPAVTVADSIATWDLGPGESETIALAMETPETTAVIDDRLARACAAAHRVPCIGTLGLVLAAKRRGGIAVVRPALVSLIAAGFYVSETVLDAIVREAGE